MKVVGPGPGRSLLHDYESSCGPSFQALETSSTILGCNDDVDKIRELIINIASKVRATSSSSGPTNAKWKQMDRSGFNAIYVT